MVLFYDDDCVVDLKRIERLSFSELIIIHYIKNIINWIKVGSAQESKRRLLAGLSTNLIYIQINYITYYVSVKNLFSVIYMMKMLSHNELYENSYYRMAFHNSGF